MHEIRPQRSVYSGPLLQSYTEFLVVSQGLTDGNVAQGGLFREDSIAGRTLDLLDLLRPSEAAELLSEFDLIGFVDL